MKDMMRSRGFSLLEVMLALVVVAIGVSVLLTFSASSQRETSNKATGNDYSLVVNELLNQFIQQNSACSASSTCIAQACNSVCTVPTSIACTTCISDNTPTCAAPCATLERYQTMDATAYDYLCDNTSHSQESCSNFKISATQLANLRASGVNITPVETINGQTSDDLTTAIQVSVSSKRSDQ